MPVSLVRGCTREMLVLASRSFDLTWLLGGDGPEGPAALVGGMDDETLRFEARAAVPFFAQPAACGGIEDCLTPRVCSVAAHVDEFSWWRGKCTMPALVPGGIAYDPALVGPKAAYA